ncbi:ubiquinone biosynthesis protein [Nitratiruptor sp. YY08-26]|uniref:ABC1 kinase family protein n=1 Tax=unclassified Nitratiruptor TaxID=2624044 RepID=UPI00191586E3|nr:MULTISPECIES: AarF/ABC1/UbiB kinase family protein [unclassified Nitratiruptor]BCD61669.1 ubiquinone biosynthesis protein [Nitratiruptor sp. YY08-13]BCD65604.1 ubiquinone biosynthesis protein [Nitratiruptor sp. YY08-26]
MFDSIKQLERLKTIALILTKNGFDDLVSAMGLQRYISSYKQRRVIHLSRSERIRKTVEELGPTFIKMAQILSTRPDLIPLELANEFSKLQDRVEAMPFDKIEPVFIEEFGKSVDQIFVGELTLLASASLGQVYRGRLHSGEEVAIKVLKPGIEDIIAADIAIMKKIATLIEDKLYKYGIDSPLAIIEEFEKSIKKELDFTKEALNLKRFAKNFANDERIIVPKLYGEFSTKKVLTMDYIEGIKVSEIEKLKNAGIDPKIVAKNGFELLCKQIFVYRFFHADPHPGNIFVLEDGRIAFIDFGMMGSIGQKDRRYFVDMIYYVVKEEEEKAALAILKLAKVKNEHLDEDAFAKEMGDVIRTYFYGSLKDIDIRSLLNDVVTLMSRYRVYFRENNYLLVKALITIEGVGKALDPEFNAAQEIKPFIMSFYKEYFSLNAFLSKASEMPKEVGDFFKEFPDDIKAIIDKMKNGQLKIEFEHVGLEKMEESIEKSANRLSLAIVVSSILIGSALLLVANTPPLIYGIPIFGLAGFLIAVVMGGVLIYSIYKKGRL